MEVVRKFDDALLEKVFVIEANLDRRQLNDFQKVELSLPLLELEKKLASMRKRGGKTLRPIGRRGEAVEIFLPAKAMNIIPTIIIRKTKSKS
jgi:hypothetical protein